MGEVIIGPFPDPIRRAIEKIGGERGLRESTDLILLTTKLGPMAGEFVTGLQGRITPGGFLDFTHVTGRVRRFRDGERWTIRWDYDPEKGPHVNFSLGSHDALKYAILSNSGSMSASMAQDKFQDIVRDQSRAIGFHRDDSPTEKGRRARDLVNYWADRYFAPPPDWTAQIRRY